MDVVFLRLLMER